MKKLLCLLIFVVMLVGVLAACDNGVIPGPDNGGNNENTAQKEDVITVEDGYLVVNGVKTDYQVKTEDVIEVVDGYVTVNGVKTEHKVDTPDVIEVIDGYVYVNGVKTDIYVPDCNHSWTTVTTMPTCTAGGYDTKICTLCGKSVTENETAKLDHTYSTTYSFDDNNHWFTCTGCDATKDQANHTPDAEDICTACQMPMSDTFGVVYDISSDGTYAEVITYEGKATKVKIASEYQGLPVRSIFDSAFKDKSITSVVIPSSVTTIGNSAFSNCFGLASVVIPDSVTTIGSYAFSWCSSLTSVVIPDSVTTIGSSAFYCCQGLTSVVIGNSVTAISDYMFYCCIKLENVSIGNSVISIGNNAFAVCNSLTTIYIPDNVEVIGGRAFSFSDTGAHSSLQTVVLGKGLKRIGSSAFYNCYMLTSINIPYGVTDIGDGTFAYCSNLTDITIPNSVTNIGSNAFLECHSSIYTEYEYGKYVRSGDNPYAVLIEITYHYMSSYIIHEDTMNIASYVFGSCPRLGSIVIPDSVVGISDCAFTKFTAMYEPDTVNLTSVVIGNGVRRIGDHAFDGCTGLNNVKMGNNVVFIGDYAFYNCPIVSVMIPGSVKTVGLWAFSSSLKDVYYTGSQSDWNQITFTMNSGWNVKDANIHYNYVPEE